MQVVYQSHFGAIRVWKPWFESGSCFPTIHSGFDGIRKSTFWKCVKLRLQNIDFQLTAGQKQQFVDSPCVELSRVYLLINSTTFSLRIWFNWKREMVEEEHLLFHQTDC